MKVKIITNGKKYRLQRKKIFGWKLMVNRYMYYMATVIEPIEFNSLNDAVKYLRKKYGETVTIVECWYCVNP